MPVNIVVPELGESVVEATVARWLKKEGDPVAVGETLVELETDKVNLEVGVERAGVLARIERKEGEDVKIGDVLGVIEEPSERVEAAPKETRPAAKEAVEMAREEKPLEIERKAPERTPEEPKEPAQPAVAGRVTPTARRLAQELGIDLAQVPAGPGGRVTKQDLESYLQPKQAEPAVIPAPSATGRPQLAVAPPPSTPARAEREIPHVRPPFTTDRTGLEERIRMTRRRQTIARRLVEAQQTAAMLTTFNEVDMTAVMEIRHRRKEFFKQRYGVSLGIVSFFVKAVIGALKEQPLLNAEIQGDEIVLKHYYDIGIAVGASEGLVVPVLRDADRMSFAEIEKAIKELAQKAQEGTLSLEDLRGGTFTITNGGVFGSLLSTPILNPPQVGILGLHKIEERPVVINREVAIRPMMYVALSYDHRIVDGREAVQFLVRIKQLIEDPEALLLEG
ncbi:MAG: 2-oxoglutarate dehydrogenase complex dihydrolipoyllysine-residue succinyltransferase [Acidobacteria bacterium]|nr:2-oxoglutarate dehydrogenase complex dihydrolipoyllysine-residue succinyltransferase [Acidobacteriota bacterium]